jgi:hypothetical protein
MHRSSRDRQIVLTIKHGANPAVTLSLSNYFQTLDKHRIEVHAKMKLLSLLGLSVFVVGINGLVASANKFIDCKDLETRAKGRPRISLADSDKPAALTTLELDFWNHLNAEHSDKRDKILFWAGTGSGIPRKLNDDNCAKQFADRQNLFILNTLFGNYWAKFQERAPFAAGHPFAGVSEKEQLDSFWIPASQTLACFAKGSAYAYQSEAYWQAIDNFESSVPNAAKPTTIFYNYERPILLDKVLKLGGEIDAIYRFKKTAAGVEGMTATTRSIKELTKAMQLKLNEVQGLKIPCPCPPGGTCG